VTNDLGLQARDAIEGFLQGVLDRSDYRRTLGNFSHTSFSAAPAVCLAAFDELASTGLTIFCRRHDPYHDIPLVTSNARPIIRLPTIPATQRTLLPIGTR
jgi:hypothetical protein